jgi:hypothetical protein
LKTLDDPLRHRRQERGKFIFYVRNFYSGWCASLQKQLPEKNKENPIKEMVKSKFLILSASHLI